jgi:hypothetical protein
MADKWKVMVEQGVIDLLRKEGEDTNSVIRRLLDLADKADEAGLSKNADAIASLLPSMRIMRAAQYEGFQQYWIANGRAFEKSYWQKRQKRKLSDSEPKTAEDYKSAHDAWFDTLEEYQKGLLGNHEDLLSKFASKEDGTEETEEASGTTSPGSTMSEAMTARYERIKQKAKEEGKTEGQEISEWLSDHKEASRLLLKKIALRMAGNTAPGVAFYEAMDEFVSGKWLEETKGNLVQVLADLKEAAVKSGNDGLAKQAGWAEDAKGFFPERGRE